MRKFCVANGKQKIRFTSNKKLLAAPGLTTRNKKLLGAPGIATSNKKLLVLADGFHMFSVFTFIGWGAKWTSYKHPL